MKLPDSPPTPEPRAAASAPRSACIARLLAILTLALYWPATQCGFVNYDDADYVTANPEVQGGLTYDAVRWSWTTGHAFNWHPLTWMSLMLNADLFGLKPFGFHLVNIALHAAATVLLFYLLLRLTGARWRSAVVAALFAWHPVHVESVAWVSERKDVLSACFGFLALWLYVAYVQRLKPESPGGGHASRFMLHSSCFFFACGLLSKPMLVTWPLVLLLLDYWPLERFKTVSARSLLVEKLPFFGLSVAASVVTFLVQRHGGAVAADGALPFVDRASNALVSYCRYLGKMFWPADLVVLYRHPGAWPLMTVLLAIIFLGGVSAWCWSNRDKRPYLLMGWLWYLGTLLPVIGLVQVGEQAMADRYTYIPSVGVFVLLVWAVCEFTAGWRWRTGFLSVLAAAALLPCVPLTLRQINYWQDNGALFRHALTVTKDSYTVRHNVGNALLGEGHVEAALAEFEEALRRRPDYAPAHYDVGVALDQEGKLDLAIQAYLEALRRDPDYADAHNSLGIDLAKQGRAAEAIAEFQAATRLLPDFAQAHENLGVALAQAGRDDAALLEFQTSLKLQPNSPSARGNFGNFLSQHGQADAAIAQYQTAVKLAPDNPALHEKLAGLFLQQGRAGEAIREFQELIRLKPDDAVSHNNLGLLFAAVGQLDAALDQFQTALRLAANNEQIHYNFANALAKAGKTDQAIGEYREALRLKPDYASAQEKLAKLLAPGGGAAGNPPPNGLNQN